MNFKKILMAIPYFLVWIIYVRVTIEDRTDYMQGKNKGMKVLKRKRDLFGETVYYDPFHKPERNFVTWREYWTYRGYIH